MTCIAVREGAIYLPRAVVDTYFSGIDAVIVLIEEGELMVIPVHQATAGGCLLKIRNAAGDRVVQARDVFQDRDLLGFATEALAVGWQADKGALCAKLPPVSQIK
ncbi:hypothetical protein RA2_01914 [Roseovarius sp. A-2]|uniref:hypothetical protein n=1 Tax=Roseovarius sp. A-2 TaxID=1570360 RepID=UPI0009B55976|nr:hypothetical protein [Roseovarius sp. A-2]GAW34861.1 hypothetical protein RA2_01914 [Roseovarius sp. A-2]